MIKGWIGVDFDGTLSSMIDGSPIQPMVARVKEWRRQEVEVRICTARVNSKSPQEHRDAHTKYIQDWCLVNIGEKLPVTAEKDYDMLALFDDLAFSVETNTGNVKGWKEGIEASIL